jgi:hypothetical protein
MDAMEAITIAFLESYISEFKRPDWMAYIGLYEQKDRVKKAEYHLSLIRQRTKADSEWEENKTPLPGVQRQIPNGKKIKRPCQITSKGVVLFMPMVLKHLPVDSS